MTPLQIALLSPLERLTCCTQNSLQRLSSRLILHQISQPFVFSMIFFTFKAIVLCQGSNGFRWYSWSFIFVFLGCTQSIPVCCFSL